MHVCSGPDLVRRLPNLSHPPEMPGQLAGTPDGPAASASPDDESLEQVSESGICLLLQCIC